MDNIKNDKYYINQILDDIDKIEEFIKDNIWWKRLFLPFWLLLVLVC